MSNKIEDIRRHHGEKAAEKAAARAAAASPQVGDRYGRALQVGDRVHYHQAIDLLGEVLDIVPILDPRAPAGAVSVVIGITIPIQTVQRKTLAHVTRIWSVQEIAAMAQEAGEEAPEAPPAPEPPGIVLTDADRPDPTDPNATTPPEASQVEEGQEL